MRSMGAKVKKRPKSENRPKPIGEESSLEEVLLAIGGSGTVVKYKK